MFYEALAQALIVGLAVIVLPINRIVSPALRAEYQAAMYRGPGVRVYAAMTITGAALTGVLAGWAGAKMGWTVLTFLARFSKWHVYGAVCHAVAFALIAMAGML